MEYKIKIKHEPFSLYCFKDICSMLRLNKKKIKMEHLKIYKYEEDMYINNKGVKYLIDLSENKEYFMNLFSDSVIPFLNNFIIFKIYLKDYKSTEELTTAFDDII